LPTVSGERIRWHAPRGGHVAHDGSDGGTPGRREDTARISDLHEDLLGRRPVEAGSVEGPRGRSRLSVAHLCIRELLGSDCPAEHPGEDDEGEPAGDRERAVAGAPPPGSRGDRVRSTSLLAVIAVGTHLDSSVRGNCLRADARHGRGGRTWSTRKPCRVRS
jgi:hypothetical protein